MKKALLSLVVSLVVSLGCNIAPNEEDILDRAFETDCICMAGAIICARAVHPSHAAPSTFIPGI